MLKFREGKLMLFNLVVIVALVVCATFVVPEYGVSTFYNVTTWLIAGLLVIQSISQILLARVLYKIASEAAKTNSKTEVTEE